MLAVRGGFLLVSRSTASLDRQTERASERARERAGWGVVVVVGGGGVSVATWKSGTARFTPAFYGVFYGGISSKLQL